MFDVVEGTGHQKSNEDRNIFFIHGLGGDATAWEKVAEACVTKSYNQLGFSARKCHAYTLDYNKYHQGIYLAAYGTSEEIRNKAYLNKNTRPPERNILIAHSQGGIVSRAIMHLDFVEDPWNWQSSDLGHKGYGGLVTVASSLQGAMILNNRPEIHKMANDACWCLTKGPTSSAFATTVAWLLGINMSDVCKTLSGDVLKMFFSKYYDGITESYVVDGPNSQIDTFNNDRHNADYCAMPKVVFYAVEPQSNIMWRTAQWLVNNPNKNADLPSTPHFGANDDWKFYNETVYPLYMNTYCANYYNYKQGYENSLKTMKWSWWYPPVFAGALINNIVYANKMSAWSYGKCWFERANDGWKAIIGARVKDPQTGKWIVKEENDGIVLAESANSLPCAQKVVKISPKSNDGRTTIGSSHMQVRNDKGIKEHLNNLFDGLYGDFFETEKK